MARAYNYTGEPLPYQFKPEPSPKDDDIPVDVPNKVRIRRFTGRMNSVMCFYTSRV